jgi:glycosyltransferase involved in cell wall biosynthesis
LKSETVIVVSTVHGPGYGAEAILEHLLTAWRQRLPLVLVAPPGARAGEVAAATRIPMVTLPTSRDACLGNLSALWRVRKSLPPARIVHAWHPRGFELAVFLARLQGCLAAGTLHDHPRAYYHGRIRRFLIAWASQRFASVVAVSRATEKVGRACGLKANFRVILNGIDDQPLPPSPGPRRIGFLGMNTAAKGFPVIQDWIRATMDMDWVWHLYGEVAPELRGPAEALVRQFPDRVFLRGRLEPRVIFREIGILVHASTAFETFGTVLVEAGRAAVPVVAAAIGGTAEVVAEGETGYLFDGQRPAQGLVRLRELMVDRSLCAALGQAGRRRFEKLFQAERMAGDYADFWRETMNSHRSMAIA